MQLPQLIFIAITMMALGISLAKDGQPSKISSKNMLIGMIIEYSLLFWGGFFSQGIVMSKTKQKRLSYNDESTRFIDALKSLN